MKKILEIIAKVLLVLVMLYLILYSNIEILCEFERFMWPTNLRSTGLTDFILFVVNKSILCSACWAVIAASIKTSKTAAIVYLLCILAYLVMLVIDANIMTIAFCITIVVIQGVFIPITYLFDLKVKKRGSVGE